MSDYQSKAEALAAGEASLRDAEKDVLARFAAAKKARQANPSDEKAKDSYREAQAKLAAVRAVQRRHLHGVGGVVGGDAAKTGE